MLEGTTMNALVKIIAVLGLGLAGAIAIVAATAPLPSPDIMLTLSKHK